MTAGVAAELEAELREWAEGSAIGSPMPIDRADRTVARVVRHQVMREVAVQAEAAGFSNLQIVPLLRRVAVRGTVEGDTIACRVFRPRVGIFATARVR